VCHTALSSVCLHPVWLTRAVVHWLCLWVWYLLLAWDSHTKPGLHPKIGAVFAFCLHAFSSQGSGPAGDCLISASLGSVIVAALARRLYGIHVRLVPGEAPQMLSREQGVSSLHIVAQEGGCADRHSAAQA
jgi:hypothetical protein